MDNLDRVTAVVVCLAVVLIISVTHSPFSIGVTVGALFMAAYGWRTEDKVLFVIAPSLPTFSLLTWGFTYLIYRMTPHTVDQQLLALDHGIGISIWHWALAHKPVYMVLFLVYYGLGAATGVAVALSSKRKELLTAWVLAAMLAPIGYFLFPAVGPRWIGHEAARNCVPSMHFTWAMLLAIYASPRSRWWLIAFALLTGGATMGLGEHYFLDLVVALPFTACVCWVTSVVLKPRLETSWQA